MRNIREGYQAFLAASPRVLWKNFFWTYLRNVIPLSTLQMLKIAIDSNRLKIPLRKLLWNSQNGKTCIELQAKPSLKDIGLDGTGIPPDTPILASKSLCKYYKFLWSKCKKFWLNKVVESFWVSKGSWQIRLLDKSVKVISHFDDLKILFPGNPIMEENLGSS